MDTNINVTDIQSDGHGASRMIGRPDEVVRNPRLTLDEKRAILAAWASDAHAVEDAPALRRLDDGSTVAVDDVLRALRSLDRVAGLAHVARWRPTPRRRGLLLSRSRARQRPDDDDDPPPRPASAAVPGRLRRSDQSGGVTSARC